MLRDAEGFEDLKGCPDDDPDRDEDDGSGDVTRGFPPPDDSEDEDDSTV